MYKINNFLCVYNDKPVFMTSKQAFATNPFIDIKQYESVSGLFRGFCVTNLQVGLFTSGSQHLSSRELGGYRISTCQPVYSVHPCYIMPDSTVQSDEVTVPETLGEPSDALIDIIDRELGINTASSEDNDVFLP